MLYHIFKQIWAQRKYNTWIFIELMLVFVLVWVLADYAFVILHNKSISQGFDVKDTYRVTYDVFGKGTSRYNPTEDDSTMAMENLQLFVRKIKAYENVEEAALTYMDWGSLPYSGGYNSTAVEIPDRSDSTVAFAETKNVLSGEYFRLFRYTSAKDHSWERPAGIDLRRNNSVFITRMVERELFGTASAIGKVVKVDIGEGPKDYVVADVLNDQKRFDYTLPHGAVFGASPLISEENLMNFGVCIRVKPGVPEDTFIRNFRKEMTRPLRIGNFYLKDIQSFKSLKQEIDYSFGVTNEMRTRAGLMIFFLLNIALGIIGTFWFRNETRRGEIGLRMAMGSTHATLQWQFMTEALLLFSIAVIPAIVIDYAIARADVLKLDMDIIMDYETVKGSPYITQNASLRFLITNAMTYVFLSVIVALSAWIPARRVSRIHPVEALRENG